MRYGDHYFYNDPQYTDKGLMLFHRSLTNEAGVTTFSLIALNFTDSAQQVAFTFPVAGDYTEQIGMKQNLVGVAAGEKRSITIESNYGCVWTANL